VWCRGRPLSCLTLCCTQPASATPGSSYSLDDIHAGLGATTAGVQSVTLHRLQIWRRRRRHLPRPHTHNSLAGVDFIRAGGGHACLPLVVLYENNVHAFQSVEYLLHCRRNTDDAMARHQVQITSFFVTADDEDCLQCFLSRTRRTVDKAAIDIVICCNCNKLSLLQLPT